MSLTVNQGEALTIPAVFYDMSGFLSDVTDLKVSIYPYGKRPGLDYVTEADALILDAIPAKVGLGAYEYVYSVSADAQVGLWYALWEGNIGSATVNSLIVFTVTSSGNEDYESSQFTGEPVLNSNSLYSVKLEGILSTDGDSLDVECWFTSRYTPMCTTYNAIAAKLSALVGDLTEDTVNYLIYTATKEAHSITPNGVPCSVEYLNHACKMYVEYWVCLSILGNIISAGGSMKSKQLGDLKVAYADNSSLIEGLMDRWRDEMGKWERVLNSKGCIPYGGSLPMGIAHPSLYSPDRPKVGRQIREPIGSAISANDKAVVGERTRFQHSYTRPGVPSYHNNSESNGWFYD